MCSTSDIHIYYFQQSKEQTKYARELWERIRRECKYSNTYPTPTSAKSVLVLIAIGMKSPGAESLHLLGPANRTTPGRLIHPNTIPEEGVSEAESGYRDHSQRAIWMGEKVPLDYSIFARSS